jgi:hypothetical protein
VDPLAEAAEAPVLGEELPLLAQAATVSPMQGTTARKAARRDHVSIEDRLRVIPSRIVYSQIGVDNHVDR